MGASVPHSVRQEYPVRNDIFVTLNTCNYPQEDMANEDSKALLWAAVQALMNKRFGKENLNQLAREAKVGKATAMRLKTQETSVGLEILDRLAQAFGVEPWQLLVPGFNPDAPPDATQASPMARDIAQMLDAIEDGSRRRRAYALVVQLLQFGGADGQADATLEHAPAPTTAPQPHR